MSYTNEDVDVKKYYSIVSTCLTCPNTTTVDKERNMVESFMNMINQSLVEAAVLEKKHTIEVEPRNEGLKNAKNELSENIKQCSQHIEESIKKIKESDQKINGLLEKLLKKSEKLEKENVRENNSESDFNINSLKDTINEFKQKINEETILQFKLKEEKEDIAMRIQTVKDKISNKQENPKKRKSTSSRKSTPKRKKPSE